MPVKKDKFGVYYYYHRYIDSNGITRQKKIQNKKWKTRKEALAAEKLFIESLRQVRESNENINYETLYDMFSKFKQNRIKSRSILTYKEVNLMHIIPIFGKVLVSQISKESIRRWQKNLLDHGYSNSYLKNIQANFRRVLNWGVNHDIISKNPFTIENVKRNERKKEMLFFTLEDYSLFSEMIDDEEFKLIFDVLYWCGLRKGELQALKFSDVDLVSKTITISKNYDYRSRKITTPKNTSSYREVMLTTNLTNRLADHIEQCKRFAGFDNDLFLFGYDKPISCTTLERRKNEYCQKAGLPKIRVHDFRHSHVSLLINSGVSDFDIAKRLGHSRDMVNNTYGHWFKKNQINLVNKLDQIIKYNQETHNILN